MAVLKKSAGLGGGNDTSNSVDELAESFMLLMTVTKFLEVSTLRSNWGIKYPFFTSLHQCSFEGKSISDREPKSLVLIEQLIELISGKACFGSLKRAE